MDSAELIVVVGPTASGKTALAIEIAEALDAEIISADSVQVYRHFNIGAGKPTAEQLALVSHHLIDLIEPDEKIDAATWAALAERTSMDIRSRGRRVVVCGGTFLWVRALLYGLAAAPPGDEAIRNRHRSLAESEGRAALHAKLARIDPPTAGRLNPNDFVRVSRALEVYELTNVPMSQWQSAHGFREQRHPARLVGVERTREEQDARILARASNMLGGGWVEEVRSLTERGYADSRAMKSVGYRQVADAVARGSVDVDSLRDAIYRATRIFARRQRTWLRDEPVDWVRPGADWQRYFAREAARAQRPARD